MRVTTELWVSALVRRAFATGGFAAVARRGATEAGAAMLTLRDRAGGISLYAPAPQTSYDEARPDERMFAQVLRGADEDEVQRRIERELRFDPDLWVVDFEIDEAAFSELVTVTTP